MQVLFIGNESLNKTAFYLSKIAVSCGMEMHVTNLHVDVGTLEEHASNIKNSSEIYNYGINIKTKFTLRYGLINQRWNAVVIQQLNGLAGVYKSYEPYLTELLALIHECAPQAKVYLSAPWAYDKCYYDSYLENYGGSCERMHRCIVRAVNKAAKKHGLGVIPVGSVISGLSKRAEFDLSKGGVSLLRKGDLGYSYGSYAAAAVAFGALTGQNVTNASYAPIESDRYNGLEAPLDEKYCDEKLLKLIKSYASRTLKRRKGLMCFENQ